jgi:NADH-quinone oxidoreductase subunit E
MGTVIHIAEIAALLAVAYALGWGLGYAARRIAAPAAMPVVPVERIAAVTAPAAAPDDALVKAPVVAPVASTPPPAVSGGAPVAPASDVSGIETLKSLSTAMPLVPEIVDRVVAEPTVEAVIAIERTPADVGAEVLPEPAEGPPTVIAAAPAAVEVEPVAVTTAMPASQPGIAWSGAIHGHEAAQFVRETDPATRGDIETADAAAVPEPGLDLGALSAIADDLKDEAPRLPDISVPAAAAPEIDVASAAIAAAAEPAPEPSAPLQADPTPEPIVPPEPPREYSEQDAMRAIEGGWSRRDARALPDAPELTDVTAAVSAAQMAVEQVLVRSGIDPEAASQGDSAFGKPRGLPHPRQHQRDNLKQINGLSPLDESTLNNLGIYHLDQVAAWDQKEVLWLENHVFARGRIGREDWQGQARALLAGTQRRA